MPQTMSLFEHEPEHVPQEHICGSFEEFHRANPEVYTKLVALARQVRAAGWTKYSIWALFASLRWHYDLETRREEQFKLNNNHTARYARLIMAQEPDLQGFFELRRITGTPNS